MIINLGVREEDNIFMKRKNKKMNEIQSVSMGNSQRKINESKNETNKKIKIENNLRGKFISDYK